MTLRECVARFTSPAVQQRGAEYAGAVRGLLGGISGVTAEVRGTRNYEVNLRLAEGRLVVSCTCPFFTDRESVCKHLWAVTVAADEKGWLQNLPGSTDVVADIDGMIQDDEPDWVIPPAAEPWQSVLANVVQAPRPRATAALADAELLYVILAPSLATLTELPLHLERRERKRDGSWGKPHPARITADMLPALSEPDDRWALSLLHGISSYPLTTWSGSYPTPLGISYLRRPMIELLMPRLCATGRVRLRQAPPEVLASARADSDIAVAWDDGPPWRFGLVITGDRLDGYRVEGKLARPGASVALQDCALLADGLAIIDGVASGFDMAGGNAWIGQLRNRTELLIPGGAQQGLRAALVRSGVEDVEVPADLKWETREVAPRPRVTIGAPTVYTHACPVSLEFEYEGTLAPFDGTAAILSESGEVMYRRDQAAELNSLTRLKQLGVAGLDGPPNQQPAIHERRLTAAVHALVSEGWHVEAEGVRYRTLAPPTLRIRSGIDWFELDAATDSGEAIAMPAILSALAKGQRTVTLGDGTVGILPEEWLASVAPVISLAERSKDGLRFRPSQAALVEAMLAGHTEIDWDAGFAQARERLDGFSRIEPEPAPPTFVGQLRGYQCEALGWLRFLREFGFGGCLADDMGLGKTVVVLALLEARRVDTARERRPSLVVLPRSLVFNWTSEAARFTPELRVLDFARADRHAAADGLADADVVLTTYGTLRRDVARLQAHHFDYVILDEAQAIKNEGTATARAVRLLRGDHRLTLTGTPVENHLGELYSLFEFLNPGLLGSGRLFERPRAADALADRSHLDRVARGLRPFILRRTKDQVAPELPARTEETLFCELDAKARGIYDELRDHYRQVLLRQIDRDGVAKSRFAILEALLRLRQAACHTGLLSKVTPASGSSAKFDVLLPRLAELAEEGRKALVFSQFTSLLALLRPLLDAAGHTYEYLDGKTVDRASAVERFQTDPACGVFLISLKAGGTGLNLTAAENVFLLDPWWNPAVEMQAIDRTHRIGQTKPVFAYRLVARDTVEERILELQAGKRALADAILNAGAGGLRDLQRDELEQLLT
jgi:superfamily II DNA or RNA helicase